MLSAGRSRPGCRVWAHAPGANTHMSGARQRVRRWYIYLQYDDRDGSYQSYQFESLPMSSVVLRTYRDGCVGRSQSLTQSLVAVSAASSVNRTAVTGEV